MSPLIDNLSSLSLLVVVEGSGVVQAKVGDTANFTWSFASSVGYGAVSKVTLGPWQSNKMSYLIGMYSDSKVILNPNLSEKEEFRDRVQFSVDIEKGTATFLYKNIQESDADKVFGVEVYTLKEFYQFNSKLEIVGKLCDDFFQLNYSLLLLIKILKCQ